MACAYSAGTRYEELAHASTPLGEISLRKRYDRLTQRWVHEVRLGDEYLMSSQFNATELALAELGLAEATGEELRVLVAGLGLGFTAHEALKDARTTSLVVVELVGAVIDWHVRGLVPDTSGLAADPRCELVEKDFFEMMRSGQCPPVDVLLVDIDHSPEVLLAEGHGDFYSARGVGLGRAGAERPGRVRPLVGRRSRGPPARPPARRVHPCARRGRRLRQPHHRRRVRLHRVRRQPPSPLSQRRVTSGVEAPKDQTLGAGGAGGEAPARAAQPRTT